MIVAGSTMKGEEPAVLRAFRRVRATFPNTLLILAPRHTERVDDVEALSQEEGFKTVRRSELAIDAEPRADVVILDSIGELATIYQLATVAFVGGSLVATGGHNILEPAVFGKPIVFGPHMSNFAEIADAFVSNVAAAQVAGDARARRDDGRADDRSDPARPPRRGGAGHRRSQSRREGQVDDGARGAAAAGPHDDVSVQRAAVQTHCLISSTLRPRDCGGAGTSATLRRGAACARPVISVGNLSVGGTGKTPLVAQIAAWLIERGERPAILSRGYGRASHADGVVVVSDGRRVLANLDASGDEPMMLARAVGGAIVAVAENRHLAGVVAERRLGATVHVLDDGFQHVQLERDFDVLMTRPGEVANGRVLPMGRLREGADAAARADLVVVLDADAAEARTEAWALGISQSVGARRVLGATCQGANGARGASGAGARGAEGATGAEGAEALRELRSRGIAQPQQFFDMLSEAGYPVAGTIAFPDHHNYSARDIARIADAVRSSGAAGIWTTEKDAVRFERVAACPFSVSPVAMRLELDDWDVLAGAIEAALQRAREAA